MRSVDDEVRALTRRTRQDTRQTRCTYPRCKCIVSTSTSQPEPTCPLGLPAHDVESALTAIGDAIYG